MSLPPKRKTQTEGETIPSLIPGGKPLFVPPLPRHFDSSKVQFTPTETFPREAQTQDLETTTGTNQKQTTTMAKKKSGGKIAFVDAMLLSGKYMKSEIATALSKDFGVPEKTARNTVSWCSSTIGDRHDGKESKHKPEAKDESKPAESKAPKAKAAPKKKASKVAAPKSKAPKKKAEKPAEVKTEAITEAALE